MKEISRREFIELLASAATGGIIAALFLGRDDNRQTELAATLGTIPTPPAQPETKNSLTAPSEKLEKEVPTPTFEAIPTPKSRR